MGEGTSLRGVYPADVGVYMVDVLLPDRVKRDHEMCLDLRDVHDGKCGFLHVLECQQHCISGACLQGEPDCQVNLIQQRDHDAGVRSL